MSGACVLVGTRKGAFVLTGRQRAPGRHGPHFGGWEIYHMKGSPADPNRLYASQSSGWFGQLIQRSSDGGKTWEPVGNKFVYDGVPGTHQWYDGTPHPWEFARVWHLEPSLTDPDTIYAGVEDAALFRSTDGGQDVARAPACACTSRSGWQPGPEALSSHDPDSGVLAGFTAISLQAHSDRRRRRDLAANQLGTQVPAYPIPSRGRHCSPDCDASIKAGRPLHAEALGRDAQR
jgi:hypothetical protein